MFAIEFTFINEKTKKKYRGACFCRETYNPVSNETEPDEDDIYAKAYMYQHTYPAEAFEGSCIFITAITYKRIPKAYNLLENMN